MADWLNLQQAFYGLLGGLGAEVLHWWQLSREGKTDPYARQVVYWIATLAMILFGGIVAGIWPGGISPLVALIIGLTAPMILKTLSQIVIPTPKIGGGGPAGLAIPEERRASVLTFLAGR